MKEIFAVEGTVSSGRSHRIMCEVCQDSFLIYQGEDFILAVVSDGVSGASGSHFGSTFLTHITKRIITSSRDVLLRAANEMEPDEFGTHFVAWLQEELWREIRSSLLIDGMTRAAALSLCATFIVTFVTYKVTVIVGCGDGVIGVNNEAISLIAAVENRPETLVYGVVKAEEDQDAGRLLPFFCGNTNDVQEILLASDGLMDRLSSLYSGQTTGWLSTLIDCGLSMGGAAIASSDDVTVVTITRRLETSPS